MKHTTTMTKCNHKPRVKRPYLEDYFMSEKKYNSGERQKQCPNCKLWIWESEYYDYDGKKRTNETNIRRKP